MQDCKTQILTSISDDTYCSRAFAIGLGAWAR